MMKQVFTAAIVSLFWVGTLSASPDVALQDPDGRAVYFHTDNDQVIITICKDKIYLEGRQSCSEVKETRKVPLQRFANHLKLIMLSDRVTFAGDVQSQVDLYKKHGSLLNLEVLKRRKAKAEEGLRESKTSDATWQARILEVAAENLEVPPSETASWQTKLDTVTPLVEEVNDAEAAINELDQDLIDLVDKISEQKPDDPYRLVIKDGAQPSFEALLLGSYVSDPTVPLVWIPIRVERFRMGSPEDEAGRYEGETTHEVALQHDILVTATEMTNEQLQALGISAGAFAEYPYFKGANGPRENVSWHEAKRVAVFMSTEQTPNVDLPTEAQWEYIARAGSNAAYCFGDNCDGLGEYGWFRGNSKDTTRAVASCAVASLLGNKFGVFDMHGNVWEWCDNVYPADKSYFPPTEHSFAAVSNEADSSDRVLRGGGWGDGAQYLRSAYRGSWGPDERGSGVGFRLVRPLL